MTAVHDVASKDDGDPIDADVPRLRASVIARSRRLTKDLLTSAVGGTPVPPDSHDWRFQDPAWTGHPVYHRLEQAYLASCRFWDGVLDDVARTGRSTTTARFLLNIAESAAAPTNTFWGNPAAVKQAYETGGRSVLRGMRNLVGDIRHNGGMPSNVDRSAYQVGENLAITPGAVVDRDDVGEVLQYWPTTDEVHVRPVLVVPPPIGRYYFLDLRPGRSFVEYAVSRGLQTFMLSWRNPTGEQAHWSMDTYAARILSAVDAVREVTGSDDVDVIGFCAGDKRVSSAAFGVTMLDFGVDVPIRAFSAPKVLSLARWNSARSGVITARNMGNVFMWMRPNELVWNYWVNDYLLGKKPPAFDVLAWNADGTNLPARLHAEFLDIFEFNSLVTPGTITALGSPVDLGSISIPTFVAGGITDHLTPWTSCFRTTRLMGGESTFVLSNAGHIQSLVNPPGNPKASYFSGPPADDAETWLARAEKRSGTWWTAWADWVIERSAGTASAPADLGSASHAPLEPAPGSYVRDRVPAVTESLAAEV
jgi:poly[(R)-3-hydroxyalkanoate] polymerase subunit PhaC